MKFHIGLSRRAYAKHRGCNDKAVRNAITDGRIAEAVLPDGTINAEHADRLWEQNTDPVQRRGKEAMRANASMAAIVAAAPSVASPVRDADDHAEVEVAPSPAPKPKTLRAEMFEEDPPRRSPAAEDDAAVALLEHLAQNRGKRDPERPGDVDEIAGPDVARMLHLALEEKAEKVRKLRLANDEKERSLVSAKAQEALLFGIVRAITEDWQIWPDVFGPELAAKYGIDQRAVTQDLRDAVRERLLMQSAKGDAKPGDDGDLDDEEEDLDA